MTNDSIPTGREQEARAVLAAEAYTEITSKTLRRGQMVLATDAIRAMLAFADTPPPAAAGDREVAEAAARIIDPDAWHETLPIDSCGAYWIGRRNKARTKGVAILALRTPEPNSGGEASDA